MNNGARKRRVRDVDKVAGLEQIGQDLRVGCSSEVKEAPLESVAFPHQLQDGGRTNLADDLQELVLAAEQGARNVTRSKQVVADAVEAVLVRWEVALRTGKHLRNLKAWASRVAANQAKRIWRRLAPNESLRPDPDREGTPSRVVPEGTEDHAMLLRSIECSRETLRGRQFDVILKLSEPGMTLHRAAKELGMDRKSVRRSFHSALARLRKCPPPLLLAVMLAFDNVTEPLKRRG